LAPRRANLLLQAAAARLNVSIDELSTEPSMVVHTATQKKIAYGDLVADAAKMTPADPATLKMKDPKNYRIIGKDMRELGFAPHRPRRTHLRHRRRGAGHEVRLFRKVPCVRRHRRLGQRQ
jgi:hypothetical protein